MDEDLEEDREVMKMASTTVRISLEAQEALRRLSAQAGRKMQEILDEAVELYRRQLFLEKANAAFVALGGIALDGSCPPC